MVDQVSKQKTRTALWKSLPKKLDVLRGRSSVDPLREVSLGPVSMGETDVLSKLGEFAKLARGSSQKNGAMLLSAIVDIFKAKPEDLTEEQKHSFGDIMQFLAYEQEVRVRADLAQSLASDVHAPRELIHKLAGDEINVARPVLANSPVLTDDVLIAMAGHKDQPYLHAISSRPKLGEELVGALLERGDDQTLEKLLLNKGAKITEAVAQKFAERAMKVTPLQTALFARDDISNDILTSAYFYVEGDLKDKVLNAWADVRVRDLEAGGGSKTFKRASATVDTIERRIGGLSRKGALTENQVIRFVRRQQPMEFLFSIAKIARIDVDTARKVVDDRSGKSLIVICKANNWGSDTFKEMAMSPLTCIATSLRDMLPLISLFESFSEQDAERVIRLWRKKHDQPGVKNRNELMEMASGRA